MSPKFADKLDVGLSGLGLGRALLQEPAIFPLGPAGKPRHITCMAIAQFQEKKWKHSRPLESWGQD